MIDQEHSDDSGLRKEAPTLFGIPDHDPFIVEKDLFERFPHQVQGLAAARNRRCRKRLLRSTAEKGQISISSPSGA